MVRVWAPARCLVFFLHVAESTLASTTRGIAISAETSYRQLYSLSGFTFNSNCEVKSVREFCDSSASSFITISNVGVVIVGVACVNIYLVERKTAKELKKAKTSQENLRYKVVK